MKRELLLLAALAAVFGVGALEVRKSPNVAFDFSGYPQMRHTELVPEDKAKSEAAYNRLLHRYGREDYPALRGELLRGRGSFVYPGEFIAAVTVFSRAGDVEALKSVLRDLNGPVMRDSESWSRIDNVINDDGPEVYRTFLMACPLEIYIPGRCQSLCSGYAELLRSGQATDEQRLAAQKACEADPQCFVRLCGLLGDENDAVRAINTALAKNGKDDPAWRRNVANMLALIREKSGQNKFQLSDYPEFRKFMDLLDCDDAEEMSAFLQAADALKLYNEAAEVLLGRLDQPVTEEKMELASQGGFVSIPEQQKKIALDDRHTALLYFLLKAGRDEEARDRAVAFYGPGSDPVLLQRSPSAPRGMAQRPNPYPPLGRENEPGLPAPGSWDHYQRKYDIGRRRGSKDEMFAALQDAIADGEKNHNPELVTRALCRLSDREWGQGHREEALTLARRANACAVGLRTGEPLMMKINTSMGLEARREAARALTGALEQLQPPGWREEWERVLRREFLDGQTILLDDFMAKLKRWDGKLTLSADDEIFRTLCGEEFQRANGFCLDAQVARLRIVPFGPGADGFEAYLQKTLDDFEMYKASPEAAPYDLARGGFYNLPDVDARRALLAKYLYDRYPELRSRCLVDSLPARDFGDAKTLLEQAWNDGSMVDWNERREGLNILLEKAPSEADAAWCRAELAKFGPGRPLP